MNPKDVLKLLYENEEQYQPYLIRILTKLYETIMKMSKTRLIKHISRSWKEGVTTTLDIDFTWGPVSFHIEPERETIRFETYYHSLGHNIHDMETIKVLTDDTFRVDIYAETDGERLSIWKNYRSEKAVKMMREIFNKIMEAAKSKYRR